MIERWIPQYNKLGAEEQQRLAETFEALDIGEIEKVYEETYLNQPAVDMEKIEEIPYVSEETIEEARKGKLKARAEDSINKGEFAVLLMAGGQGTRLGHPGPKGTFSFDGVSLFELQARQLKKHVAGEDLPVHWYIMTSDINHTETLEFFEQNDHFGLPGENVHFFKQEHFPPVGKDKTLLLTADRRIMMTPNGNGGVFASLYKSGMLEDMKARGVRHVFMNNVDNAVVKVLDPLLAGLHLENGSEITSKSIVPKPGESVGRLSLVDGAKAVVEYTELPEGSDRDFLNGNIGIHIFTTDFMEKAGKIEMPYHLALKKLSFLDADLNETKEEVLKFEKFYFDAFSHAETHHTLQVDRKGEFSPLKNKEGKDSIETAYQDLKAEGLI